VSTFELGDAFKGELFVVFALFEFAVFHVHIHEERVVFYGWEEVLGILVEWVLSVGEFVPAGFGL
jgi:hypothetical protein